MTDYNVTADYFVLTGSDVANNRRKDGPDNGYCGTLVIDGMDHDWILGSRLRIFRGHGSVRKSIALSKREDAKAIREAIAAACLEYTEQIRARNND
jgi:hypothetical protein